MKVTTIIPFAVLALSACVPTNPIVSDYNGASVTIVTSQFADREQAAQAAQAEATRICRTGGSQRAEYASTRANPQTYENFNLYLCL
ncbi:hypothetical protein V8J82_14010 [Gymnodinialimonas sp. 2305UL16-5]|uniref:hypothetical protein n=1 Tax=Gymnodinialimonas mytili TaxID=3126503 RepID=UPI003094930F